MKILAVCLGAPEALPGRKMKAGINKHPVKGTVMIEGAAL